MEQLLEMTENGLNLIQIFAKEAKVFFNQASEYWRIYLDVADIKTKYAGNEEFKKKEGRQESQLILSEHVAQPRSELQSKQLPFHK